MPRKRKPGTPSAVRTAAARADEKRADDRPGPVRQWVRAKRPVLAFVGLFVVLLALFYSLTFIPVIGEKVLPAYMRFNATAAAAVMNVFGEDATARGTQLSSPRPFAVDVRQGCDAVEPTALFVAAVLAFPAPFRYKVPGAVVGILVLAVINLIRIITLFYTGAFFPRAFRIMHEDVWQVLFILFALTLWILWAWWATRPAAQDAHAAA